jgi:DNA-binding transcriptional LysR family regulator
MSSAKGQEMSLAATLRDLNQLNTFVKVAERRSFTKAAADLRATPSVVSKHIKELEASLGFSLFTRSTHGIVLTDAGEGLFQSFQKVLGSLDDYVVDTRNRQAGPFGTLRVQTTGDYARHLLAPVVLDFAKSHPALRVHLFVGADNSNTADDGIDVIVASRKPPLPGLVEEDLGVIPHVVCASPAYFSRAGRPTEPQDLREHNCFVDLFSGPNVWPFKTAGRPLLVEVKGSLSSNSASVLVQMALQDYGIIRVPRHAVRTELAAGRLVPIFEEVTLSPERMAAYFSKAKQLPAKTVEFLQFLQASIVKA